MRLVRVEIENFRSISRLSCEFDNVTTLVGPNGVGKSTVLRALDWMFNGTKACLTDDDRHFGTAETGLPVRIRADFSDISDEDRSILGRKYCPEECIEFSVWRTWDGSEDKLTGKALAFPSFEDIRGHLAAIPKRSAYNELRTLRPDLGLPTCGSAAAVDLAMDEWERDHPDQLVEAEVSDTHMFGFNGQGVLTELFDFVFVSADLRAAAETEDNRTTILGRILQRAIDRSELDAQIAKLTQDYELQVAATSTEELGDQLAAISKDITEEIQSFVLGRELALKAAAPVIKPQALRIEAEVTDGRVTTPVHYQGHGFQRTLLLAALTVLSRRGRKNANGGQMFLAVEEPELFQHPTQAKALSSVLRALAQEPSQLVQVAYATHSPYFVQPQSFNQIRRVTNRIETGDKCASSAITTASFDQIVDDLKDFVKLNSIQRRWEQVCLKYLPEALFAESVMLVEGEEDAAILEAVTDAANALAVGGVCVAPVQGKSNLLIPFAILRRLGIRTLMVADNDSSKAGRMRSDGKREDEIGKEVEAVKRENRALCRFVGAPESDYPVEAVTNELFFMPDTLESVLDSDLPEWGVKRTQIVREGRGVDGKNAATYALAARECGARPTGSVSDILALLGKAA
jgi:hypothetical protein